MAYNQMARVLEKYLLDTPSEIKLISPKHFAAIMIDRRVRSGLGREELGDIAGIHPNSIRFWEVKKFCPTLLLAETWANALQMDMHILLVPRKPTEGR